MKNKEYSSKLVGLIKNKEGLKWEKEDTEDACTYIRFMFANDEVDPSLITNSLVVGLMDLVSDHYSSVDKNDRVESEFRRLIEVIAFSDLRLPKK